MKPTDKQIKAAVATLKRAGYFAVKDWQLFDIIEKAADYGVKLNKKQAREIADYMEGKGANAEVGINWDSIKYAIEYCGHKLDYSYERKEN